ncbi:conserved Plasmodium protein, unknown function [Plasmodium knowlesi strain H]|uniref:FHA domain-containing protein n=3 Tax=Plasmodium knowlesi TaxID=5850 RepID=A0A5K1UVM5_PLAKH|nr:FHA domain-containing protein, putative [Plasmodium knowlesi strain H]OTN65174.1 Uncharacterized protein PKNOH_S120150500 [Plasmodium knowlesi]CAA9988362.1 FHA domain-containing protein, putative [Plasmodium knowlesi strain H]SBO20039.1 conserved Plasmodium protein, unknown function [Plasmodium knowlesi strain H]SBO20322.1 conserved Plasmodium protein, unknown function [Plasmodium knowlesi strain H]VVS77836.1 FHA domain-containing protein, putative [Plasmodium knowlesi strain H]|eukprot:XP_002259342.1 hypothetical protein, conserved in Plasmodium species [Plasmodium knowlesi strain H]
MKGNLETIVQEENEYKEECIFTSIDIFSGPHNYLNFHYICEISFNDISFISPYHCYFFLRNQFENVDKAKANYRENVGAQFDSEVYWKVINENKATELFQSETAIYYEQGELPECRRKALENIAQVVNKMAVSDLEAISPYLGENPNWNRNKLTWMDMLQRDKFRKYEKMRENLKETGKREIVYKMNMEDVEKVQNKKMRKDFFFFGVCEKKGQNNLGRIYMSIRNDLAQNTEIYTWLLRNCNMQTDPCLVADISIEEKYLERKIIQEEDDCAYNDELVKETKRSLAGNDHFSSSGRITVEEKTQNYIFEKKEYISFGKNEQNDIICLNPSISRFHCVLFFSKDYHLYLVDVGSKSRTRLNSNLCEIHNKYKISNNDIITLGVSKRTYKVSINIDSVLSYLDKKQSEINRKMRIMSEDLENPFGEKNPLKLKISNIFYKCNENDIIDFFKDCGEIKKIHLYDVPANRAAERQKVKTDAKKSRSLKEALVEVYDKETSAKIMQKNESYLYGRKIYIIYQPLSTYKTHHAKMPPRRERSSDVQIACKRGKYRGEKITLEGGRSDRFSRRDDRGENFGAERGSPRRGECGRSGSRENRHRGECPDGRGRSRRRERSESRGRSSSSSGRRQRKRSVGSGSCAGSSSSRGGRSDSWRGSSKRRRRSERREVEDRRATQRRRNLSRSLSSSDRGSGKGSYNSSGSSGGRSGDSSSSRSSSISSDHKRRLRRKRDKV